MINVLDIQSSAPHSIYIDHDLLSSTLLSDHCQPLKKKLVVITDSNLAHSLGHEVKNKLNDCNAELLIFPAGEIHKTRETKHKLEDELLSRCYGRDTCLIAVGGGVVTDLVGFLAATYCRGVPVIYIPTTLLAMVDACIGGKTAVNTSYGKNMIGAFYQPQAVFIDTKMLETLPAYEYNNGMVEMIKHSIIADENIFFDLKNNAQRIQERDAHFMIEMITASCRIKKNIVEQDEKDHGIRQLLNFGHTIAHAIETLENYAISHGEAVAIGMLVECYLSVQHGFLPKDQLSIIHDLLSIFNLPLTTNAFKNRRALEQLLMLDKKSINRQARFVLLNEIGRPYVNHSYVSPVDIRLLSQALDWAEQQFTPGL